MIREGTSLFDYVWLWKQISRFQSFQSALQDNKVTFCLWLLKPKHKHTNQQVSGNDYHKQIWPNVLILEAYANEYLSHLVSTNPREITHFVKQA